MVILAEVPFRSDTLVPISGGRGPDGHGTGPFSNAWDFVFASGTPLYSIGEGRVVEVRDDIPDWGQTFSSISALDAFIASNPTQANIHLGSGQLGNYITVVYNEGTADEYFMSILHLQEGSALYSAGQTVNYGDQLANVGHSGYSTGAHLHVQFSTNLSSEFGSPYEYAYATQDQTALVRLRDPDEGSATSSYSDDRYYGQSATPATGDAGNTVETALDITSLLPFSTRTGSVGFGADTQDFFYMIIDRNGSLSINLSDLNADLDIYLLDYLGNSLGAGSSSVNNGLENETITWSVLEGQGYYLQLSPYNGAQSSYSLDVSLNGVGGGSDNPDLTVSNVRLDETTIVAGSSTTIRYDVVENNGEDAGGTSTGIYIGTSSNFANATFLESDTVTVDANEVDAESEVLEGLSGYAPGTYYLWAVADNNSEASESNESNNVSAPVQLTITGAPAGDPDLTVSNVRLDETTIVAGSSTTIRYDVVENNGEDAGGTSTGIYIGTSSNFANATFLESDTVTVDANEVDAESEVLEGLSGYAPGTYYLWAVADNNSEASESNESNNLSAPVQLTITGAPAGDPDLTVSNVRLDETTIVAGSSTTIRYDVVENSGEDAGGTSTGIYIGTSSNFANATFLESDTVTVDANEVDAESEVLEGLSGYAPGTYYLWAVADNNSETSESNESNNVSAPVQLTITETASSESGTLSISAPATQVQEGDVGDRTAILYEVSREGGSEGSVTFDWIVQTSDPNILDSLGNRGGTITFPDGDTNPRAIVLYVDGDDVVEPDTEVSVRIIGVGDTLVDPSANVATVTMLDDDTAPGFTDLRITAAELDESVIEEGSDTLIRVTVNNDGNLAAGSFTVQGFLSDDGVFNSNVDTDTATNFYTFSGGLAAGASSDIVLRLDGSVAVGTHNLFIVADINSEINESNESNNFSPSLQFTVTTQQPQGPTESSDVLVGTVEDDVIDLLSGSDTYTAGQGDDYVLGGNGHDTIFGNSGDDEIRGGADHDTLYGNTGLDLIWGNAGNDDIFGGADRDIAYGGSGNDTMFGGQGADSLRGESGDDEINGEDDNDYLFGLTGDDVIRGGNGDDYIEGGAGLDRLLGNNGSDEMHGGEDRDIMYGGAGNDLMNGGDGVDSLRGENGSDILFGGNQTDYLFGQAGNDKAFGGYGQDFLFGGSGRDQLFGSYNSDVLDGESGTDFLYGGFASDTFVFKAGNDLDIILDWEDNYDVIDISGYSWSQIQTAIDEAHQTPNYLNLDFGDGDVLSIANAQRSDITLDDFV